MPSAPSTGEPARVRFIRYKGKSILLQDFSNMRPGPEFFDAVRAAKAMIASQPPKSVLTLLDATNSVFDAEVLSVLKDFAKANTPFMKSTTVVGITGLKAVGLIAVSRAAGRPIKPFATRDEAMEYLAALE